MTCTCNKEAPAKIDWTKPIQLYSLALGKWVDGKLLTTLTQGDYPRIVQTDRGVWAFTDLGRWEDDPRYHIRNKPREIVRAYPTVEIYRTESGSFYSRVFAPTNKPLCPDTWKFVGKASVPVAWEA